MSKFSLPRASLVILLSLTLSSTALAQIYSGGSPAPAPAPTTTAPAPTATTPAPTATTSAPTPTTVTPAPGTTTTTSAASSPTTATVSNVPGYSSNSNYSTAKTVGYIIAPFAIVAGTYLIGHRHQVEIHPNAGFFWPRHTDNGNLRDEGMYGLKASAALTDNFDIEGNFAYVNHFEGRFAPRVLDQSFCILPRTVHGLIYDVNGVYNFGRGPLFGSSFFPYVTAGIGGLSTLVDNGTTALIDGQVYTMSATGTPVLDTGRKVVVADNSAFFSVNYGAGIKTCTPVGAHGCACGRPGPHFPELPSQRSDVAGGDGRSYVHVRRMTGAIEAGSS